MYGDFQFAAGVQHSATISVICGGILFVGAEMRFKFYDFLHFTEYFTFTRMSRTCRIHWGLTSIQVANIIQKCDHPYQTSVL